MLRDSRTSTSVGNRLANPAAESTEAAQCGTTRIPAPYCARTASIRAALDSSNVTISATASAPSDISRPNPDAANRRLSTIWK